MAQRTPIKRLDRKTARAMVEAGYMPLADYVAMFGEDHPKTIRHVEMEGPPPPQAISNSDVC